MEKSCTVKELLASLRLVMISKVGSQWILADKTGERMFTMPENWDISEVKCLLENKALVGHSMDDILKELLEKGFKIHFNDIFDLWIMENQLFPWLPESKEPCSIINSIRRYAQCDAPGFTNELSREQWIVKHFLVMMKAQKKMLEGIDDTYGLGTSIRLVGEEQKKHFISIFKKMGYQGEEITKQYNLLFRF